MTRPEIVSRKLDKRQKPFSDELEPKYWLGDCRSITEFIHSLSALFPEGEAFFIRSVKAFENDDRIQSNPNLLKDIRGFISQEGQHTAEHVMYNKKIEKRYGHNMERINLWVKMLFVIPEKYSITCPGNYACLAVTCSLEHFTSILAELLLTTPQGRTILDSMSQSHRTIWIWHAIEEIEHKSVTFDVFQAVGGSYICRVYWHILTTILFLLAVTVLNIHFAINTGDYLDFVGFFKLLYFLFVSPGFLRLVIPLWAEYLRPNYHPWGSSYNQRGIDERNSRILEYLTKWQNEMQLQSKASAVVSERVDSEAKIN